MCTVVGYLGSRSSREFVIKGLERLQYRGYDSAGYACLGPVDKRLIYLKAGGELSNLLQKINDNPIDGPIGIGHTRWSTHGVSSTENAHPHFDCHKTLSVVHNGIIENHALLRTELIERGHQFYSQTDSEIIAHLIEQELSVLNSNDFDLHDLLRLVLSSVVAHLEGAYAFIAISQNFPDAMMVVRKGSPLCIGFGEQETFVASDTFAFGQRADRVSYLPDQSYALIVRTGDVQHVQAYHFDGSSFQLEVHSFTQVAFQEDKAGYAHFMLKEIREQQHAISKTISALELLGNEFLGQLGVTHDELQELSCLNLIGCGSSWHAGRIGQFFFESIVAIPTSVVLASEFRYMPFFPRDKSIYIGISQSGETADTLEALRLISQMHLPTVALTNVASSTMVRETRGSLVTQAGIEVAVASTKAFGSQIAALYWLAHRIAFERGSIKREGVVRAVTDVMVAAQVLDNCIEKYARIIIENIAPRYALYKKFIFLGRHVSYPFALEASLKLKEISYIFAQCYPAGELKHGPLALVDQETPVFIFSVLDDLVYHKLLSNAQEVKARNGHLVVFAFEGQEELCQLADTVFIFPRVAPLLGPLAMAGVMQFLVYQIAVILGCHIDRPRNLAKSVTVE